MDVSKAILFLGVLAFLVSVITQVLKNVKLFKKVPTNLFVLVVSLVLTVIAYVAYVQYSNQIFVWYNVFASFIAGFIVAFIAMFGWSKLSELWNRCKGENKDGEN